MTTQLWWNSHTTEGYWLRYTSHGTRITCHMVHASHGTCMGSHVGSELWWVKGGVSLSCGGWCIKRVWGSNTVSFLHFPQVARPSCGLSSVFTNVKILKNELFAYSDRARREDFKYVYVAYSINCILWSNPRLKCPTSCLSSLYGRIKVTSGCCRTVISVPEVAPMV